MNYYVHLGGQGMALQVICQCQDADCLKHESSEGNDKLSWGLVIVLTNWIGALIYFFVRRPERKRALQVPLVN